MATAPTTLGERVKAARKDAGLSVEKLRDRVRTLVPDRYVPGIKTFYRIEADEVSEEKVEGILIVGIARACGVRISAISQEVADETERVSDLVSSSLPWIPICPGQLELALVAPDLPADDFALAA